jgi:acetyl-CoA carboxylase biotin carboxylase subunit
MRVLGGEELVGDTGRRFSHPAVACYTPSMARVTKLLIANRGEIAVRIIRTCRAMGIASVAVHSAADADALHVRLADEALAIGAAAARASYLDIAAVLGAARAAGADAIHPGYGFLAENAEFAAAVVAAGLTFVGPPPPAIAAMGDKVRARALMQDAGVPVLPASGVVGADPAALADAAAAIGYPVLVKAAAGGGGKGMRIVRAPEQLADAVAGAAREATAAFGDGRLYLERYLERPRHVEVQIFADTRGTVVHLGERECSIQRRHQKIVEETPSPAVTPALRDAMTGAAIRAAQAVGYVGAGTVEFLLDPSGVFFFLEMNTRLQVEHPITEWTTGLDLVREQIEVARGAPLSCGGVRPRGHAIECRLYSEDPLRQFLPATGVIAALTEPAGPGVRFDAGIAPGTVVGLEYDPLLAKVSTWGATREEARARMIGALRETVLLGVTSNRDFLLAVLAHPAFIAGDTHTDFIPEHLTGWRPAPGRHRELAAVVAALALGAPPAAGHAGSHAAGARTTNGTGAASVWQTLGAWRPGASAR